MVPEFTIFKHLSGDEAREAFNAKDLVETRGYFEEEDAWIAFDFTSRIMQVKEFLCEWQAWAFAATDIAYEGIWEMTSKEFTKAYNKKRFDNVQEDNSREGRVII